MSTVAQDVKTSEFDEAVAAVSLQNLDNGTNLETEADQNGLIAQVVTLDLLKVALPQSIALPVFERGVNVSGVSPLQPVLSPGTARPLPVVTFSVYLPAQTATLGTPTGQDQSIAAPTAPSGQPGVPQTVPTNPQTIDLTGFEPVEPTVWNGTAPSTQPTQPGQDQDIQVPGARPQPGPVQVQNEGQTTGSGAGTGSGTGSGNTDPIGQSGGIPPRTNFIGLYRNTGQGRSDDHAAIMALGPQGPERNGGPQWRNSEFPDVVDIDPSWAQRLGIPPEFQQEASTFFEKLQGEVKRIIQLGDAGKATLEGLQKELNEFLSDPRIQWGPHCGTGSPERVKGQPGPNPETETPEILVKTDLDSDTLSVAGEKPLLSKAGARPAPTQTVQPPESVASDRPVPKTDNAISTTDHLKKGGHASERPAHVAAPDLDTVEAAGSKPAPAPTQTDNMLAASEDSDTDVLTTDETLTVEAKADPTTDQAVKFVDHARRTQAPAATSAHGLARQAVERSLADIADKIQEMVAAARPGTVSLRLTPHDLGTIDLTVRQSGQRFDVEVRASDSRVGAALTTSSHELAQSVQSRGLNLGSFDVNHGQGDGRHQQGHLNREDFARARALSPESTIGQPQGARPDSHQRSGWPASASREIDYTV